MERLSIPPDVPVESKVVTRAIRSAQTQVEQQNFEIRKDVLKYDDVLNRQRQVIYGERRTVLEGADLHEQIREMVDEVTAGYVAGETSEGYPEEWDLDKLWRAFRQLYPVSVTVDQVIDDAGGERAGLTSEFITEASSPTRRPRTNGGSRNSVRRLCGRSSAGWCSQSLTASGASTCTRWTTCVRASACAATASATR